MRVPSESNDSDGFGTGLSMFFSAFCVVGCAVFVEKLMRVDELGREGPFRHKEIIFTRFGTGHYKWY